MLLGDRLKCCAKEHWKIFIETASSLIRWKLRISLLDGTMSPVVTETYFVNVWKQGGRGHTGTSGFVSWNVICGFTLSWKRTVVTLSFPLFLKAFIQSQKQSKNSVFSPLSQVIVIK